MVKSVEISNFRGFESLKVSDLELINVIVGDNAVGKTALLEALFLALSGSAQKPFNLRQWRGMDVTFQAGSADSVVEGIYADLFHDPGSTQPIRIELKGRGFENRQLVIEKTRGDIVVPTKNLESTGNRHSRRMAKSTKSRIQTADFGKVIIAPISLTWIDQNGRSYVTRAQLSPTGLIFQGTGEPLPTCFMFAAQIPVPAGEAASHYSALRKRRDVDMFRSVFMKVFDQITDISVESDANSPVLLADVPWAKQLLPLPALSGGTTRAASILLALANRRDGLVLVDEVESGIYHARQERFARALLEMSRANQSQLFMTTHSDEWIQKFLTLLPPNTDDVAFWRMERIRGGPPTMRRFSVADFISGSSAGEMR